MTRHVCLGGAEGPERGDGHEMGRVWQCSCGNLWGCCGEDEGHPVWALLAGHVDVFEGF